MSALIAQPSWLELLTFSRRHAGIGFARRPGRIADRGAVQQQETPSDIIALADRVAWWRGDQGIALNLGRASSWLDIWFSENLVEGTAANQPLVEDTGLLGQRCVTNDTGARRLSCTLSTPMPAGSRWYAWAVLQWTAVGSTTFMLTLGQIPGTNSYLGFSAESPNFRGYRKETAVLQDNTPTVARDTSPHRHELGYTTGGTDAYVTDSTSNFTSVSGAPGVDGNHVLLFRNIAGSAGPQCKCAEIIISKTEPSASTKTRMRTYISSRYAGL